MNGPANVEETAHTQQIDTEITDKSTPDLMAFGTTTENVIFASNGNDKELKEHIFNMLQAACIYDPVTMDWTYSQ